jgi:GT2 family glycosyltransferase
VVLENALFSAQKRLCIILFTPFQNETTTIGMNFNEIPDIGFRLADITDLIEGRGAYAVETVNTETQYGVEHLIYVTIKQCMASVTALIKTFLRDKYLFNCVRSLKSQAPNIRIVVADDGHVSDQKERTLNELGVDRYIQLPFNSAPIAKARNLMVDAAETEHVLIGDDDFTYTPASNLVNMCSLMNLADIAGGAIMQSDEVLHYEGVFEREGHNMMLRPLRGSYQNQGQTRYIQADYVYNFFVAKTSALRKVRWDKRIRASYEHEDFFLSAKEAGLKVVYCPNSVVLHRYGPQDSPEYQRYRYSGDIQDKSSFESKWGFGLSF